MGAERSLMKMGPYVLVGLFFFTLAGCETPPSAVEEDFGASVRNTIALQTMQPGQQTPSLDGVKGEAVLRSYQGDVAKPEQGKSDLIQIDLGK